MHTFPISISVIFLEKMGRNLFYTLPDQIPKSVLQFSSFSMNVVHDGTKKITSSFQYRS